MFASAVACFSAAAPGGLQLDYVKNLQLLVKVVAPPWPLATVINNLKVGAVIYIETNK